MIRFLVPTDFSPNARHAAAYAFRLASALDASILLMHSYEAQDMLTAYQLYQQNFDTQKEPILQRLDQEVRELELSLGLRPRTECLATRAPLVEQIQKVCEQNQVDLVVVGLTGTGVSHMLMGDHILKIVNQVPRPVLTVPPKASYRPIRKVLFACDLEGMDPALPAFRIREVLNWMDPELLILNIRNLRQAAAGTREPGDLFSGMPASLRGSFHNLEARNIIAGIKDFARDQEADLILMLPQKHDFLENLLGINHTRAMLFRSGLPILTIPLESASAR